MQQILNKNKLILIEAAIVERLRRSDNIVLHHDLVNAPLIYDQTYISHLKIQIIAH